jgi:hypothetical protein
MDKEIKVTIPNVRLSDLERLVKKSRSVVGEEDVEISFEFIIASLFPTSWKNIQAELSRQYTKGYIQGRIDKEEEIKESRNYDDDPDCYCE